MNKVCFSPEEYDALCELSHLAQMIYFRALRPYMDYATGLIGRHRGISYQSIAEALYVPPKRGRHTAHTGSPSKKAIRNAVDELIDAGVVANRSTDKKLILQALHAYTDQSAQSMRGTSGAHEGHSMKGTSQPSSDGGSGDMSGTSGAHPENTMRGTPPNSVSPPPSPRARAREPRPDAVEMTLDWEPSQQAIDAARMQGVPEEFACAQVGEFRLYWMGQGKADALPGWDSTFVGRVLHEWRKGARTARHGCPGGVSSNTRATTHDEKHSGNGGQHGYRSKSGQRSDAAKEDYLRRKRERSGRLSTGLATIHTERGRSGGDHDGSGDGDEQFIRPSLVLSK